MDEIKKFKDQNGNVNYSVKDLIGALHIKLDRVEEKVNEGSVERASIKSAFDTRGKWLNVILPLMIGMIGGLLTFMLSIHGII